MTKQGGGDTINRGPAPQRDEEDDTFDVIGNTALRREDPSPDDRARGETSNRDETNRAKVRR
jgi:hypothetical protein